MRRIMKYFIAFILLSLMLFGFVSLMGELATVQPNVQKILTNK